MKNMINSFVLLLVGMMGVDRHALRADVLQPIVSRAGANRICVELCSGALGGAGCGDFCLDLVPDGLPVQYGQDSYSEGSSSGSDVNDTTSSSKHGVRSSPRESVCGVLCENNLGYPLCQCEIKGVVKKRDRPNFLEVCAVYCNAYNYQLHGCQECSLYKIPMKQQSSRKLLSDVSEDYQPKYDWSGWCNRQCINDNGGAACNCDMLPMMTAI